VDAAVSARNDYVCGTLLDVASDLFFQVANSVTLLHLNQ
jgi:hypothetical protein